MLGLALAVDDLAETQASLEERKALRGNRHLLAGLRVAPFVTVIFLDGEVPEIADFDPLATLHGFHHLFKDGVHHDGGTIQCDLAALRDGFDQFRLGHEMVLPESHKLGE